MTNERLQQEREVAAVFMKRHPEFPKNPAMAHAIERWLRKRGAEFNIINLEAAWSSLSKAGTAEQFADGLSNAGVQINDAA